MRSRLACLAAILVMLPGAAAQYRTALPGYVYKFPRDHFNHPDYQTEWWYYTGNVRSAYGHRFGFELTFFRRAVDRDAEKKSAWDVHDLYVAHLALSDLDGHAFYHTERVNRAGPGIAGISETPGRIWNGNWRVDWPRKGQQKLSAIDERFQIDLTLHPEKPPIVNGENGVSQKGDGPGRASHYISLTRIATAGQIELAGKRFDVNGLSWMDHEFFTQQLERDQVGWDWLSVQLDDKTELMLFHLRRKDGSIDPHSAGTFVDAQGRPTPLQVADFDLRPLGRSWTSSETHATYPVVWAIAVPPLGIALEVQTPLPSQELTGDSALIPNYWEGAINVSGQRNKSRLAGVGYLEMTGYDHPVESGL